MTSPCSVSFRRPSTDPGAWPRIARLVGPPPRHRGELALGPVEHPGRREEARLLVRIRVAEHHLLPIASGGECRAVGVIVEERGEDRACGAERRARLEQRHDIEDGYSSGR